MIILWRIYHYPLYYFHATGCQAAIGSGKPPSPGFFDAWNVAAQQDVQTQGDMWDWLNYTVPELFWVYEPPSPTMDTYNQLLGYFSIRVQYLGLLEKVCFGEQLKSTARWIFTADVSCDARKTQGMWKIQRALRSSVHLSCRVSAQRPLKLFKLGFFV